MKSEKAQYYIDDKLECIDNGYGVKVDVLYVEDAVKAAGIAEQEAEQRMRDKAIKAFTDILYMPAQQLAKECGVSVSDVTEDTGIDYCRKLFIQKLNVG